LNGNNKENSSQTRGKTTQNYNKKYPRRFENLTCTKFNKLNEVVTKTDQGSQVRLSDVSRDQAYE